MTSETPAPPSRDPSVSGGNQETEVKRSSTGGVVIVTGGDDDDNDNNDAVFFDADRPDPDTLNGFGHRLAKNVARNPCIHLWVFLLLGIGLSMIALVVGEFEVSAETGGWQSRGTLIADRQAQLMLASSGEAYLFYGGEDAWVDLTTNVQDGWEVESDDDDDEEGDDDRRRSLSRSRELQLASYERFQKATSIDLPIEGFVQHTTTEQSVQRKLPFAMTEDFQRILQDAAATSSNGTEASGILEGCDVDWYTSEAITGESRLWPIWKTTNSASTALDPVSLYDICVAEANTLSVLEKEGLCFGCPNDKCLQPYSLVLYARMTVPNGLEMSCTELLDAWAPYQQETEEEWKQCAADIKANTKEIPESCSSPLLIYLMEEVFDETGKTQHTSSIFPTPWDTVDQMYEIVEDFDNGSNTIEGFYDTQWEGFVNIFVEDSLTSDMAMAVGSAGIVAIAIIFHTRSPFITAIGLAQIVLSFPLAYFVYKLILGLDFFPFLNFIGIFVVFALGAGDVFVAIDKWKNARLEYPKADVQYIAAVALPDAAAAMFLTTLTTAVAFFATAICPVAPIKMFAVFCGLLIIFDYIMNVLLVFPALCIYDNAMMRSKANGGRPNCCMSCTCCGFLGNNQNDEDEDGNDDDEAENKNAPEDIADEEEDFKMTFSRKILLNFYDLIHSVRWPLFVVCLVGMGVSTYYASTLQMPTSSDVRLLDESNQFEQNYLARQTLLAQTIEQSGGSEASVIWGVIPADTGDQNNPASWTQLVLDNSFDASSTEAQEFLLGYCEKLFDEDFATLIDPEFICPMNRFDSWLLEQSLKNETAKDGGYVENCGDAASVPLSADQFDACIISWAESVGETSVLSRNGKVQILSIPFTSRVRFDDNYSVIDDEWNLIENWINAQFKSAPSGVNNGYFSSFDFWWYDTNGQMLQTAYSAAGIALGAAAAVILFSSQSILMTIFSTLTIGYVLTSVTACLVAIGWTLGFLEAICFAILIGVSVDFVIHFSHAYTLLKGDVDRGRRTKYALVKMGPSILATAFTTMLSAVIMLFTVISFFQKFALILFFTVIQASVGSFIVFLNMVDCIGPTNPTYLVEKYILGKDVDNSNDLGLKEQKNGLGVTQHTDGERGSDKS